MVSLPPNDATDRGGGGGGIMQTKYLVLYKLTNELTARSLVLLKRGWGGGRKNA